VPPVTADAPAVYLCGVGHLIAIGVALLSAGCYAIAAVLQQREASRHDEDGLRLVTTLLRRPAWWMAVTATLAGATLHVVALAFGPLTLVQPIGVSALVLALPLGAWFSGRKVQRREWGAAAAVVAGLMAVLTLAPRHVPPPDVTARDLTIAIASCVGLLLFTYVTSARLGGSAAPVIRAVGSAACFGFASAMARLVVAGSGPIVIALGACAVFAVTGMLMIQAAYRDGGLGAPLATCTIVDPIAASLIGILLLGEHVRLSIAGGSIGFLGLLATIVGLMILARTAHKAPTPVAV
jgi:drug/metabolite transporter (DMT)-like permease